MAWITAEDLRGQAGAKLPTGQVAFEDAADLACAKVEELCGPIPWATVTEYVEVPGTSDRARLKNRATRGLESVATADGVPLLLDSFRVDGQVLVRKAGVSIGSDVLVTYHTGYFDDSIEGAKAPAWARKMAVLIGHQLLRVDRRVRLSEDDTDLAGTGYVVPNAALAIGADFLLWRGGVE